MKKGGGKRKGSSFERYIAKELSLWITKGQRNDIFWRTHSSGSLGTIGKRRLEYGDIMAIDDIGKPLTNRFNIECRHGKVLNLRDLMYCPKSSNIVEFIYEGRKNASLSERESLWIFKEQSKEILVMMDDFGIGGKCLADGSFCLGRFPKYDVFIMTFKDWKREFKLQ